MSEKYEAEKREKEIRELQVDKLNAEVQNLNYKRTQNRMIVGASILAALLGLFVYGFLLIRKNRNALAMKNLEISNARKRSDELLLNILPVEIANELKKTGHAQARDHQNVTILFTDFIEFTQTSEHLTTSELVEELNYCFQTFDEISAKYELEKIKTIGDSYMAAAGVPVSVEGSVKKAVLAALEMQHFISDRKNERIAQGKPFFEMRAGVNTGSVVAGIVGTKKFQYDIWGDAVNTASRLESKGVATKVNIGESTYQLLKDDPEFVFESRGMIAAKGKGGIPMYFVEPANA